MQFPLAKTTAKKLLKQKLITDHDLKTSFITVVRPFPFLRFKYHLHLVDT